MVLSKFNSIFSQHFFFGILSCNHMSKQYYHQRKLDSIKAIRCYKLPMESTRHFWFQDWKHWIHPGRWQGEDWIRRARDPGALAHFIHLPVGGDLLNLLLWWAQMFGWSCWVGHSLAPFLDGSNCSYWKSYTRCYDTAGCIYTLGIIGIQKLMFIWFRENLSLGG